MGILWEMAWLWCVWVDRHICGFGGNMNEFDLRTIVHWYDYYIRKFGIYTYSINSEDVERILGYDR